MKKLYNSIAVLIEKPKTSEQYLNIFLNGYIYQWTANICFKRADKADGYKR